MEFFKNGLTGIFFVIFCVAIFEIAGAKSANSQSNYFRVKSHLQFDKKFSGKTSVLDGDSLKVGGKEVRLFGLDAPEYRQTCFDERNEEYNCGQVSRVFLENLAGGKDVKCIYAEKDKYDRFLSKCFIGEISINEELVKNGMAVIYNFAESSEEMNKLEMQAKEKKLGIWKGTFQLPKEYRKSHPRN